MSKERIVGINPLHTEPRYVLWGKGAGECVIVHRRSREPIHQQEPVFLLRASDRPSLAALAAYRNALPDGPERTALGQLIDRFQNWRRIEVEQAMADPTKLGTQISHA